MTVSTWVAEKEQSLVEA